MTEQSQSCAGEVIADNSGKWCGNQARYATQAEAEAAIHDLFMRWTLVRETRVVASSDPVNYRWDPKLGNVAITSPATQAAE
jgi:hypothetical protein